VIAGVWGEQPTIFQGLLAINRDVSRLPTAQVMADFVARALFRDLQPEGNQALASLSQNLGRVRIHRTCEVRGWVLHEHPAISISVISRLLASQDLKAYARQVAPPEQLIGLVVADKHSGSKGEIVGITGNVGEHRERLHEYKKISEARQQEDADAIPSMRWAGRVCSRLMFRVSGHQLDLAHLNEKPTHTLMEERESSSPQMRVR
jgi:hypothetical protein